MKKEKSTHGIILGAGRPYSGYIPSPLLGTGKLGSIIDWQKDTLNKVCKTIEFVGGYNISEIAEKHPDLRYVLNEEWESTQSFASLSKASLKYKRSYFITYSDIIYKDHDLKEMERLANGSILFACCHTSDSKIRKKSLEAINIDNLKIVNKNTQTSNENLMFVGLLYVPENCFELFAESVKKNFESYKKSHLGAFIEELAKTMPLKAYDISNRWSNFDNPKEITKFLMESKSKTLSRIATIVKKSKVPEQVSFSCEKYSKNPTPVVKNILKKFPNELLAVRSSSMLEDSFETAKAGAFHTELNVICNFQEISNAVEKVIVSMGEPSSSNHVFVQPMVKDVISSGVIFTRLNNNSAPYYRINYDIGNDTSSVTNGHAKNTKCIMLLKNSNHFEFKNAPAWISKLIEAAKELEFLFGIDYLDIEFAIDKKLQIYILQTRPLILKQPTAADIDQHVFSKIKDAQARFGELKKTLPELNTNICGFGIMPDWNPAEIIGTHPSPLAFSLYEYLVTDKIWSHQRKKYGYKDAQGTPLMRLFCGQPYIDIKASLYSFTPANVSSDFAKKYVEYALKKLKKLPHLHDKIEFKIIPTCYDLNFASWEEEFKKAKFNEADIYQLKSNLLRLTKTAIKNEQKDFEDIKVISDTYNNINKQIFTTPLDKAIYLLEKCKLSGTPNFAQMARHGFVAISLLRSAVDIGILSEDTINNYLASMDTISSRYKKNLYDVKNGKMQLISFIKEYGHLRPGSYDITSKRYDEDIDTYITQAVDKAIPENKPCFKWKPEEKQALKNCLLEHGLECSLSQFERFCKNSIIGREESKFVFTKYLSDALNLILLTAKKLNLTREEARLIPLYEWQNLAKGHYTESTAREHFQYLIEKNKKEMFISDQIALPPLIFDEDDFIKFVIKKQKPNYITLKTITAECMHLEKNFDNPSDFDNKIICIESADPGYDWLFGYNIAALITQYGGANSHMAIRCAEFNLPAAIGVGKTTMETIKKASRLQLNCQTKQIIILE